MNNDHVSNPLRLKADLHIHTIASGHGYCTYTENMQAAYEKGLELIAITDHGPQVPEGAHPWYFYNQKMTPSIYKGMRVLHGCEANVTPLSEWNDGIDLPDLLLEALDFVQVGVHSLCGLDARDRDANTAAVIKAVSNPYVDQLNHPGNEEQFPLHLELVIEACYENNVIIELNNHSFDPHGSRAGSFAREMEFARAAYERGCPISIGSDAHYFTAIAEFSEALIAAEQIGIPDDYFVNYSAEKVLDHLQSKRPRNRINWGPVIK